MEILLAILLTEATPEDTDDAASEQDFAELFRQNYPRVYNYLRYRVNVPEDAEDLIGIVFEKAYTYRERFDADKGAFSTWLFRIAHNELANYYRSRQRRSNWEAGSELPGDLITSESSPEVQVIQQEAVAQLLQGLGQLSERDQEVISLKFGSRLSNKEIGQIMDLKEKTVSVVLLRAMRRLQKHIEEAAQ
ncbi:RNA polymerase sigma factor [Chloroflexota bacterium]